MKLKETTKILLFFTVLFSTFAFGQENDNRFEARTGYGYFQGFNIGLNYFYTDKLKVGLGVGSHLTLPPLENENHFNIQIENALYFGQLTKQNVGGWYFNQQLMYWEQGQSNNRWRIVSLGLNIGKTIPITEKLGLEIELGPAFNMVVDIKRDPLIEASGWMWPVLYNGRVQMIYKFRQD
jgi:hypothetical protein